MRAFLSSGLAVLVLLASAGNAHAHAERRSFFPVDRYPGAAHPARQFVTPQNQPKYRAMPAAQRLVVCKKPGDEGVAAGQDSASLIAAFPAGTRKSVNLQLLNECAFEHLQAAVDAVSVRGTTIYVLPGTYFEQPSVRALDERSGASSPGDQTFCEAVLARGVGALSYEEQFRCRHIQNTVAIFGDPDYTDDNCGDDLEGVCTNPQTQACNLAASACVYYDLQIEGTGEKSSDVIFEGDFISGGNFDGQFRYLNGIRADRADGIYLANFTTQIFEFNSVYVEETDGFVFDRLLSRYVDEYSFLSFASDHGLYESSGGYGVADSVLYPGSGADIYKNAAHAGVDLRARQGTEIRNSYAHHAALGYSGTAGNAPWVHHNTFRKMQSGLATESVFGGHPGMPQDHGLFEDNLIYNNNKDYYRFVNDNGPCIVQTPRDRGVVPAEYKEFDRLPPEVQEAILDRIVVCPPIPFPTGTGFLIGGGNYDITQNNTVFDNWRQGFMLFHAPAALRSTYVNNLLSLNLDSIVRGVAEPIDTDLTNPFDNSHYNRYLGNHFAENTLVTPSRLQPNGVDFWFDNSGVGNCWADNTSFAGSVTFDTGNPLQTLPSNCPDGPLPNTLEQTLAENPLRIAFLLPCINYSRTDPASKDGCEFFEPLVAPPGRVGAPTALSSQPTQATAQPGQTVYSGYFVLNNDSGDTQQVQSVTVAASGALSALSGLSLSATVITPTGPVTRSATVSTVGASNVFTFAEPVLVEPITHVLFELQATAAGTSTVRVDTAQTLLLAGSAGSGLLGLFAMVGGLRRRQGLALAALALVLGLLGGCSSGSNSPTGSGGDGGGGGAAEAVSFQLTALTASSNGAAAGYAGLPLPIGRVELP